MIGVPGPERLERFLRRAAAGAELTVAFFGGSITQGSLASVPENCYAARVLDGLEAMFPQAVFHFVNAGCGGTGSHFGLVRIHGDLLIYRPDLVVVDFSVNDTASVMPLYSGDETEARGSINWGEIKKKDDEVVIYPESFEGVLRRILSSPSEPAVIVLNNAFYDTGESVEDVHNRIADHYGVPHVSVRELIIPRMKAGEFRRNDISPDGLHPNDRGHALIADEILKCLDDTAKSVMSAQELSEGPDDESVPDSEPADGPEAVSLPEPMTDNMLQGMTRLDITNAEPLLDGFIPDPSEKFGRADFFKNGWTARGMGDSLELKLECSELCVVYRKTVNRPSPVARLVIDGDEARAFVLDGNFEEDWGDCLYLQPVIYHGVRMKHHIRVEIVRAGAEDKAPFYLICFGAV